MKTIVNPVVVVVCLLSLHSYATDWQARLENMLYYWCVPEDNLMDREDEDDVPGRERDAIKMYFPTFLQDSGWTTNQFIEGLIFTATNYITDANWTTQINKGKAGRAFCILSDINHPMVTNFFRSVNNTNIRGCHDITLPGLVQYSHLESELLDYLKGFCVQTNIYDHLATHMMMEMFECYNTLPEAEKPAAKVRLAKYMYFAIHHTTRQMAWQDRELAKFIPAYSNSFQRLSAMQYVYSTATNERQRVRASMEIERMSQLGTNQLNDVSWIAQ